jgi:hypothetical protein
VLELGIVGGIIFGFYKAFATGYTLVGSLMLSVWILLSCLFFLHHLYYRRKYVGHNIVNNGIRRIIRRTV